MSVYSTEVGLVHKCTDVKAMHLIASMQELLYCNKRSVDPADHPTQGHVSLIFQKKDSTIVKFTRSIVMSGSSENATFSSRYSVDARAVSLDVFVQELLTIGINTRARNFLVFQV